VNFLRCARCGAERGENFRRNLFIFRGFNVSCGLLGEYSEFVIFIIFSGRCVFRSRSGWERVLNIFFVHVLKVISRIILNILFHYEPWCQIHRSLVCCGRTFVCEWF
jgi:hypothetical protein